MHLKSWQGKIQWRRRAEVHSNQMAAEPGAEQEVHQTVDMVGDTADPQSLRVDWPICIIPKSLSMCSKWLRNSWMIFQFLPLFGQHISSIACTAPPASTWGLSKALLPGQTAFYPLDVTWPQLNKLRLTKAADHRAYKHNQTVSGSGFLMKKADVNQRNWHHFLQSWKPVCILFKGTTSLFLHVYKFGIWSDRFTVHSEQRKSHFQMANHPQKSLLQRKLKGLDTTGNF